MSRDRRDRRVRRAAIALDGAIILSGVGVSFMMLSHPTLAKVALWSAVFIAVTAFAILQREMPR